MAPSIAAGDKCMYLRRRQVFVSSQFLNRACGRAAHREVTAERVTQLVRCAVYLELGSPLCLLEPASKHVGCRGLAVVAVEHARAAQMP
jgi:hypothetical protein